MCPPVVESVTGADCEEGTRLTRPVTLVAAEGSDGLVPRLSPDDRAPFLSPDDRVSWLSPSEAATPLCPHHQAELAPEESSRL